MVPLSSRKPPACPAPPRRVPKQNARAARYRAYLSSCIFWSLAVPVASMAMLDGICEHAVTIYVPGSVQRSNKHVKSYSHPRARVHTDQGDLSRGKRITSRNSQRVLVPCRYRKSPLLTTLYFSLKWTGGVDLGGAVFGFFRSFDLRLQSGL